jgi:hypothetical protein
MIFFAAVALIQLIKPLGFPGLRYRRDAWKLAVAGFMLMIAIVSLRPDGDIPAGPESEAPASRDAR